MSSGATVDFVNGRQRDEEGEPNSKRARLECPSDTSRAIEAGASEVPQDTIMTEESATESISLQSDSKMGEYDMENLLPPSRSLLPAESLSEQPKRQGNFVFEADVGITEYVGKDVPPFTGIIKQRY